MISLVKTSDRQQEQPQPRGQIVSVAVEELKSGDRLLLPHSGQVVERTFIAHERSISVASGIYRVFTTRTPSGGSGRIEMRAHSIVQVLI